MPLLCKFQSVIQKIDQNLFDPALISEIAAGNGHVKLAHQHKAMSGSDNIHHIQHFIDKRFQMIFP